MVNDQPSVRCLARCDDGPVTAGFDTTALRGRNCLVTGGGSGIGQATVRVLAELGAAVAVVDKDAEAAASTATEVVRGGGRAVPVSIDLERLDGLDQVVADVTDELGPLTILVNNAGISGRPLMETTIEQWDRVLTVNLSAAFVLLKAVGARMMAHGLGGSIVNVSSSSAFRALTTRGAYGVSKAGLAALTRAAAAELGPHGINVNTVAPGVTRTPMTISALGDDAALQRAVGGGPLANLLQRVSEPEDVANVIAFLCVPASRQITAQVVHVSAGAVVAAG
jgi:NAD(P)-dependent dehydrogenase (short-subunit alcohol dehydrogenase family)